MTDAELAEIQARTDAATPGPWRTGSQNIRCVLDHGRGIAGHGQGDCVQTFQGWYDSSDVRRDPGYIIGQPWTADWRSDTDLIAGMWDYEDGGVQRQEDAEFIAHARQDIPALVAEVRRLRDVLVKHGVPLTTDTVHSR